MSGRTPQQRIESMRFNCSCCGDAKQGLMALHKLLPDSIFGIPEEERPGRVKIGSDLCTLDDEFFYVRAVLAIPIIDTDESFEFGIWGSLKQENFETYHREFDNRSPAFGPFFSWLNSELPGYPDTFNLPSDLEFRGDSLRPLMWLHSSNHRLSVDQRNGVTIDKVAEIYAAWGHTAVL